MQARSDYAESPRADVATRLARLDAAIFVELTMPRSRLSIYAARQRDISRYQPFNGHLSRATFKRLYHCAVTHGSKDADADGDEADALKHFTAPVKNDVAKASRRF